LFPFEKEKKESGYLGCTFFIILFEKFCQTHNKINPIYFYFLFFILFYLFLFLFFWFFFFSAKHKKKPIIDFFSFAKHNKRNPK
jgi:hypothetical protein